jgi:hypothetical protein
MLFCGGKKQRKKRNGESEGEVNIIIEVLHMRA